MWKMLIALSIVIYFTYKYVRYKEPRHLLIALLIGSLQIPQWPFYLPIELSLALWGFICGFFMIFDYRKRKGDRINYVYIIVMIGFGLIFLGEAYFKLLHR